MADTLAVDFANQDRALVVAPAGCGKTYLISESVGHAEGRQLVLTHTHAGVSAIRARMRHMGIPTDHYRVTTIDSFALAYARAFPSLGEAPPGVLKKDVLASEDWPVIRRVAMRAVGRGPVQDVVRATYSGMYVDEYQDCSKAQHELILSLAALMPCRIVGDPLQAIYQPLNKDDALPWSEVQGSFPQIDELRIPYRWLAANPALGEWLLALREAFDSGERIPLTEAGVSGLRVNVTSDPGAAVNACHAQLDAPDGTVLILRRWRAECHKLASKLNNRCSVFEDIECKDLTKPAIEIYSATGSDRAKATVRFVHKWLSRIPPPVKAAGEAILSGRTSRPRNPQALDIVRRLNLVAETTSIIAVDEALDGYEAVGPAFKSRELWVGLRKAIRACDQAEGVALLQVLQGQRDALRRVGRQLPLRTMSTPLLVKGLECDHCLVLNLDTFESKESMYVSMTRASRTLTLLTSRGWIGGGNE